MVVRGAWRLRPEIVLYTGAVMEVPARVPTNDLIVQVSVKNAILRCSLRRLFFDQCVSRGKQEEKI
jgi:hypothetical protein